MRTAVFLQARIMSTRLPRKALLPLAGKPSIEHAMEALRMVRADAHVLLTDPESVRELAEPAAGCGFDLFPGPREDVLARYAMAARKYRVDRYFRATGDNPLVSCELAEALHELHEQEDADFSGFLGPPLGTGVELVETPALLAADAESNDPYEREHVSPFIYRRPERFRVRRPWASEEVSYPSASVTMDTPEDYELLCRIFDDLYDGRPIKTELLVEWLREHEHQEASDDCVHPFYKTG